MDRQRLLIICCFLLALPWFFLVAADADKDSIQVGLLGDVIDQEKSSNSCLESFCKDNKHKVLGVLCFALAVGLSTYEIIHCVFSSCDVTYVPFFAVGAISCLWLSYCAFKNINPWGFICEEGS